MGTREIEKRWEKDAQALLVGRKIKKVRYMTAAEAKHMMWDNLAIVLELDNGMLVWPSADCEGNGSGVLFTTDEKLHTIPDIYIR